MKIQNGYLPIMPYLIVKDAAKFITFMQSVFGATDRMQVPRTEGIIMHGELQVQDAVIMFADATDEYPACTAGMFLYLDNVDEVFAKVEQQGYKMLQPLENRDYGRGFGFADEFGNTWWVNTPVGQD